LHKRRSHVEHLDELVLRKKKKGRKQTCEHICDPPETRYHEPEDNQGTKRKKKKEEMLA
jgi:hypothetical protein